MARLALYICIKYAVFAIFMTMMLHLLDPEYTYIKLLTINHPIISIFKFNYQHELYMINSSESVQSTKIVSITTNTPYIMYNMSQYSDAKMRKKYVPRDIVINTIMSILFAYYNSYYVYSAFIILSSSSSVTASVFIPQYELVSPENITADDLFGYSVSIHGNYAIIGARNADHGPSSGAAYIFERINNQWIETAELLPNGSNDGDLFGYVVSIYNEVAVIGERNADNVQDDSGAVYIFEKVDNNWVQKVKLTPEPSYWNGHFGSRVSIYADYVLIGDYYGMAVYGSVYIYKKYGDEWHQVFSKYEELLGFGYSVSIYNNYAIVGAPYYDNGLGAVSVFENINTEWTETDKLYGVIARGDFGQSVAISDKYMVIGAPGNSKGVDDGAVHIYKKVNAAWTKMDELFGKNPHDRFGSSVSINGDYVVIGQSFDNINYIFKNINEKWTEIADYHTTFYLSSISMYSDDVLIGNCTEGVAYVMELGTFICDAPEKCKHGDIECPEYMDCDILCGSDYACFNTRFKCPLYGNCSIQIEDGDQVSRYMMIDAEYSTGSLMININTTGEKESMRDSMIKCPYNGCFITVNQYGPSFIWRSLMDATIIAHETTKTLAITATGYCALCGADIYCPRHNCDIVISGQYGSQLESTRFYVYNGSSGLSVECESMYDDAGCSSSSNLPQKVCRNYSDITCDLSNINNHSLYECPIDCSTPDPTIYPTTNPTNDPTKAPTINPSLDPTSPTTGAPTLHPTYPSNEPTVNPSLHPTVDPTVDPTTDPTASPTAAPLSLAEAAQMNAKANASHVTDVYIYSILFGVPAIIIIFIFICKSTILKNKLLSIDRVQYVNVALYFIQIFDLYSDAMFSFQLSSYYQWGKHTEYDITTNELNAFNILFVSSFIFTILPYFANFVSSIRIVAAITSDPIISNYSKEWFKKNSGVYSIGVILSGGSYYTLKIINSNFLGLPQLSAGLSAKQIEAFAAHKVYWSVLLENLPQMLIQFYFLTVLQLITAIAVISLCFSVFSILLSVLSTLIRRASFGFQNEFPFIIHLSIIQNKTSNNIFNTINQNVGNIGRLSQRLKSLREDQFDFEVLSFSRIEESFEFYGVVLYKDESIDNIKRFLDNNIETAVTTAFECDEDAVNVKCKYPVQLDSEHTQQSNTTAVNVEITGAQSDKEEGDRVLLGHTDDTVQRIKVSSTKISEEKTQKHQRELKQIQTVSSDDEKSDDVDNHEAVTVFDEIADVDDVHGPHSKDVDADIEGIEQITEETADEAKMKRLQKVMTESDSEDKTEEQMLLEKWKLSQYWTKFEELGFDDYSFWKQMIAADDVLDQVFEGKIGHKLKFVSHVKQLQ